jgi:DNA invertase Pin-like site-specific DNA recombinase
MRAALYLRVSTLDQNPESQLHDLLQLAQQRGWQVVGRYVDHGISGTRTRRPGLDLMMSEARKGKFDVVVCWACDRMARSVCHFLEILDELNHVGVAFVSYREQIDTAGPLGRAIMVIVGAIAELERSLIIERVRAGIRRAKLEGRHIGRNPVEVDVPALRRDRARGMSLREIAKAHRIGKTTVARLLKEPGNRVPQGALHTLSQVVESTSAEHAA